MRVFKAIMIGLGVVLAVALVCWTVASIYGACVDQTPVEVFKDVFNIGSEVVEEVLPEVEDAVETVSHLA